MKGLTVGEVAGRLPGGGVEPKHADRKAAGEGKWRVAVRVLRSPGVLTRVLVQDVLTTVFPADCRHCEGPLVAGLAASSGQVICEACFARVRASTLPACARCGDGLEIDPEEFRFRTGSALLCRECGLAAPAFARAVSFGVYDGELRTLLHLFKFEGRRGLARTLAPLLAQAILQLRGEAAEELTVVAVPLFRVRERQRGFNQSVLLANAALRLLRRDEPAWRLAAAHEALVRQRSTATLFELSRRARRRNLRGAFAVAGEVRGREILLIDDILTSGATARECARVLLAAGAARVWVATVARAQKESVLRRHEEPEEDVALWDLGIRVQGLLELGADNPG